MADSDMAKRVAAKRAEHQEAILADDKSDDRYTVLKNKTSQAFNSVGNSYVFTDTTNDIKYSLSVTCTTYKKDSKDELAPEHLAALQIMVSKFLDGIHTKL